MSATPTPNSMRRARATTLLLFVSLLAAAPAAQARVPRPYVKTVTPLRASVGEAMTIKGYFFTPGYAENMVVLKNNDGKVIYIRSELSSKHKITIHLPQKVEHLMKLVNGVRVPSHFRVKVISSRMGRLSRGKLAIPVIGPDLGGDCDKDGIPNPKDPDDDNDFLPDTVEKVTRTDPCKADSDGDRLSDGWEYVSALDLNRNALPYPGKRPYPNALFADADVDYDGDGLPAWAEYVMWFKGGQHFPLTYSDGNQMTVDTAPGNEPWNDYGYPFGHLSDDERDFDGDGLSNIIELSSYFFEPWGGFPPSIIRPDFVDADTDGDGVPDGADDQDHDDISNVTEFRNGTWAMNPCDPDPISRTCPRWMDDDPTKPANLCTSSTIFNGTSVRWASGFDPPADPAAVTGDELAAYCKRPEDHQGLGGT